MKKETLKGLLGGLCDDHHDFPERRDAIQELFTHLGAGLHSSSNVDLEEYVKGCIEDMKLDGGEYDEEEE